MKNAKKAFVASLLAVVLCVSMLTGTTFAWFTDSVTSAGNIIKSGTLNIDLGIKATGDADYVSVKDNPTKKAFNYDKWEPGYTEWVNAKVFTTGNLALKYTMRIVANGTVSALAEVIDVYYSPTEIAMPGTRPADLTTTGLVNIGTLKDVLDGTIVINDTLIPETNLEDFATLALHMRETAGNEYQDLEIGTDFSFQILATQYTYERDSFDDQYDANAPLPFTEVGADADALTAAVADGGNIIMSADVNTSARISATTDTTINGNGKTVKVDTGDNRVMSIDETTEPITITLNDITLDGSDSAIDPQGYARGISLYGNKDVTLNLNRTNVSSPYYAINVASANENVEINLENASIAAGWAALNIWSMSEVNVKDSTLTGTNDKTYNADGWNDFGTIVMNYGSDSRTKDSVLNFSNTTITAKSTNGNRQLVLDLRDDYITANFTNCTFVSEGSPANGQDDLMFLICEHETITFTNCTFIKNGVELTPAQVQADYIGAYPYNDITTCIITFN